MRLGGKRRRRDRKARREGRERRESAGRIGMEKEVSERAEELRGGGDFEEERDEEGR